MMRTTYMAKPNQVERKWVVVDAADKPLGRVATEVATLLRGKHKPEYTPHVDTGDFVIVINASKVHLTGKKAEKKMYLIVTPVTRVGSKPFPPVISGKTVLIAANFFCAYAWII